MPTEAELDQAAKQLTSVLQTGGQVDDAQKLAHARRLLEQAAQVRDRPAQQFVLQQRAMELAGEAGDAEAMVRAVDAIAADFEIETFRVKVGVLQNVAGSATSASKIASFVRAVDPVIDEAIAQQQNVTAFELADLANQLGQSAQGAAVRGQTQQRRLQVEALLTNDDRLELIRAALQANPDDAEANGAMGYWLCLVQNDWASGLPYLAKGSGVEMAAAAQKDLLRPATSREQTELGDLWWKLSETLTGEDRTALQVRAASWYQEALPQLSGAARTKIEKRLESLPADMRSRVPRP